MKLSDKKVLAIIALIVIALSGLVILQFSLLKTALKAEEDAFDRSVTYALNKTVMDLSQNEAKQAILKIQFDEVSTSGDTISKKQIISHKFDSDKSIVWTDNNYQVFEHNDSITVDIEVGNAYRDTFLNVIMVDTCQDTNVSGYAYGYNLFDDSIEVFHSFDINDSTRIMLLDAALQQFKKQEKTPISERLDSLLLDSLVSTHLLRSEINLEYNFGVVNYRLDSVILGYNTDIDLLDKSDNYKAQILHFDLGIPSYYLVLNFPNKQFYIYSKLLSIIISILFFVTIIIGCFIYSIRTILKQRRTSGHLTDFINNMTHEFKTPLSTIRLAVEAIAKDEVAADKNQLQHFNNMILSENLRMKTQVDKILQIATLEEGDYIIKHECVDLHDLVEKAVESFSVHVKNRGGSIENKFTAQNSIVSGDLVHLNNIIQNLLDNSVKYSHHEPVIQIKTENIGKSIILSVKDNGIGIDADDIKLVFNKYFRVSKGDIHDVKGFGLGLSYVKMMVEAHRGKIRIVSALDKGTEVIVTLPNFNNNDSEN